GEKALEVEGRGAFSKVLFDALDLKKLAALPAGDRRQTAIYYDWTTGERFLDLKVLIDQFVRGPVQILTAKQRAEQHSNLQPAGDAEGRERQLMLQILPA